MLDYLQSFFKGKDEIALKHASSIPESASDKIFNSIVRIEFNDYIGTGFFNKLKINQIEFYFLFTCYHLIEKKIIDSKESINIFFGKKNNESNLKIKLDKKERFIRYFEKPIDITIIQIKEKDNIPLDKFLFPDLNYKNDKGYNIYKDKVFYLAGYPIKNKKNLGERHICSGEIKKIVNEFEFQHSLDTESGSSGSPICLIENQNVIGIHKNGSKALGYNSGTFIGYIIDKLEKELINNIDLFDDINYCFFTLEEYNKEIINYHKIIINDYNNQEQKSFNLAYNILSEYLNKKDNEKEVDTSKFLLKLLKFNDINNNYKEILNSGVFEDIIYFLQNYNYHEVLEKFSYFIAGSMIALNLSSGVKPDTHLFELEFQIDYCNLIKFKNCINQIISFKNFIIVKEKKDLLNDNEKYSKVNEFVKTFINIYINPLGNINPNKTILDHIGSFLYKGFLAGEEKVISLYNITNAKIKNIFNVNLLINYNIKIDKISTCFEYIKDNSFIFQLFSFFKVIYVEINEEKRNATILLDSIGRKEIIEKNVLNNALYFNTFENVIEEKI